MALVDRVKTPPKRVMHGNPCSVAVLLDTLEGPELAAFQEMLGTPERRGWSARAIWETVTGEGYTLGYQSINRHRGGTCRCAKDAS